MNWPGELDEAASGGSVSFKRHRSVRSSIDAVRAELASQQAAKAAGRNKRLPRRQLPKQPRRCRRRGAARCGRPPGTGTRGVSAPAPENPGKGGKGRARTGLVTHACPDSP